MLLIYIYVLFDNEYKKTYYDFNINNESHYFKQPIWRVLV